MTLPPIGVIAAGGFAHRLDSRVPKSMLLIKGVPLLRQVAERMKDAGVEEILVFSNRPEWLRYQHEALSGLPRMELMSDSGVKSTFQLARLAALSYPQRTIAFSYGHVRCELRDWKALLSCRRNAFGLRSSSSRRDLIPWGAGFLEPPALLNARDVIASSCETWSSFVSAYVSQIATVRLSGLGDFNLRSEFEAIFNAYVPDRGGDVDGRGADFAPFAGLLRTLDASGPGDTVSTAFRAASTNPAASRGSAVRSIRRTGRSLQRGVRVGDSLGFGCDPQ